MNVVVPVLRVARPTDDLDALRRFYEHGLGLEVLQHFEEHEGFDGIMLGRKDAPNHLEFTRARGHAAEHAPTPDNLLVFYLPDANDWETAVRRMREAGFDPVPSCNPYWDLAGMTYQDPDGYRVVLQKAAWAP